MLQAASSDLATAFAQTQAIRALDMVSFAKFVLPSPDEVHTILTQAVKGPAQAITWLSEIPETRRAHAFRGLAWLMKIGVLQRVQDVDVIPADGVTRA
jgi:alpha-maltose-1-phosphate synthase